MLTTTNRLSARRRVACEERGQGLVEFALILPVVLLVLVGIIEFGAVYSKIISMRQGIREAGRQGSVANWGSTSACGLVGVTSGGGTPTTDNVMKLMCLAKDQAGVGDGVRIKVLFADDSIQNPTTASPSYVVGHSIVICAIYPLQSLTGLMQPFLDNRFATTKAAFRIEKTTTPAGGSETGGYETPPPGKDWSWCPSTPPP